MAVSCGYHRPRVKKDFSGEERWDFHIGYIRGSRQNVGEAAQAATDFAGE